MTTEERRVRRIWLVTDSNGDAVELRIDFVPEHRIAIDMRAKHPQALIGNLRAGARHINAICPLKL